MALADVHWSSSVLEKKLGMYVILPDAIRVESPDATFLAD